MAMPEVVDGGFVPIQPGPSGYEGEEWAAAIAV